MILDNELILVDGTAIATPYISNVYDTGPLATGNTGIAIASGEPLYAFVMNTSELDDASDNSVGAVTFVSDDDSALGSPGTTLTVGSFSTSASDVVGQIFYATIPVRTDYQRYLGFKWAMTNGDFDSDVFFVAGITRNIDAWIAYASGMNFA